MLVWAPPRPRLLSAPAPQCRLHLPPEAIYYPNGKRAPWWLTPAFALGALLTVLVPGITGSLPLPFPLLLPTAMAAGILAALATRRWAVPTMAGTPLYVVHLMPDGTYQPIVPFVDRSDEWEKEFQRCWEEFSGGDEDAGGLRRLPGTPRIYTPEDLARMERMDDEASSMAGQPSFHANPKTVSYMLAIVLAFAGLIFGVPVLGNQEAAAPVDPNNSLSWTAPAPETAGLVLTWKEG